MRKGPGRLSLIVLMMLMTVAMLTGCGPKKPAPEEAQAYVKAVLDLMCTGDYDHSVDLADIEEGKESEVRDNLIDQMMSEIGSESNLSEEVTASFRDFMTNALGKAKYTVGAATETEDGGYDVTVSIEPLQIFTGVNEELNTVLEEKVAEESDKILAMSEEEQTNYVMGLVIELLNKKKPPKEILKVMYEPVTGSHVGPGTLALFFMGDSSVRFR